MSNNGMNTRHWNMALDGAITSTRKTLREHDDGSKEIVCDLASILRNIIKTLSDMKKKVITPEMLSEYKSHNANNCPHCGSDRIGMSEDLRLYADAMAGLSATRGMVCENPDCEEEWTEIFRLHDIMKEDIHG